LSCFGLRRGVHHHVACWILPRLQVTFFALLEDFYPGRLAVKDRDKTPRIIGVILIRHAARRAWRGGFVLVELEQAGVMGSSVACCVRASWWRSNRGAVRRER
jgi:hypothetical protein